MCNPDSLSPETLAPRRSRWTARTALVGSLLAALYAAGCSDEDDPAANDGGGAAQGEGGAFDPGSGAGDTGSSGGPEDCGGYAVEVQQPNLLVLFDRSCSMRRLLDQDIGWFGTGPDDPNTRWNVAREAVHDVTQKYGVKVRFGLMVFPAPTEGCGMAPPINVAPDVGTSGAIMTKLKEDLIQPFNLCPQGENVQPYVTPTEDALQAALASPLLHDPERDSTILLLTDGGATCDADESSLAGVTAQLLADGIPVAAVGFGAEFDIGAGAISMLDAIAQSGGMPNTSGSNAFFPANDAQQLDQALEAIVSQAVSCTFDLQGQPPEADALFSFLDGQEVFQDDPNGFVYDPNDNSVTFQGAACDLIKTGQVTSINVVYGCPEDLCEPAPEVCDGLDNDCDGEVDEDLDCLT